MPTKPQPTKPPPTDEQITAVVEYASQLHYGFLARPPLGSDGRTSWERRFLTTFSRMLAVLKLTRFKFLPPFALCCIWENNRRNHVKDPNFNIELIRDAYDEAHPGRQEGEGKLSYEPAYEGPFALMPEEALRTVWWTQSAPQLKSSSIGGVEQQVAPVAMEEDARSGVVDGDGEMEVDNHGADEPMEIDGGHDNGESEVEDDADEVSGPADEECGTDNASGSTMRGRSTWSRKSNAVETHRTTRSTSRGPNPPPAPRPARGKGKGKAVDREEASMVTGQAAASSSKAAGTSTMSTKGKAKQTHRGTCTLKDIPPVTIPMTPVRHPRPCERKDHLMATFLGYWYTMLSNPDVYARPNFSPALWPSVLPDKQDIAWFCEQYDAQPRGSSARNKRKHACDSGKAIAAAASTEDDGDPLAASMVESRDEEQHEQAVIPSKTSQKTRSRSTTAAPSRHPSPAQELPAQELPAPSSDATTARRPKRAGSSRRRAANSSIGAAALEDTSADVAASSSVGATRHSSIDPTEDSQAGDADASDVQGRAGLKYPGLGPAWGGSGSLQP
ncbi:hypothetical protein GSI_11339 [Ganoderma sinense ZZ0214-1]|uniref:Uncharacterized protein n=1 Tax=Ganoderma sinense ZZ0214-1 TaxID=1077348 RepID=A0A2G8RVQ2_9APHY|nr:hypothetical protein GSI_11339 [Ganoderma sinense ZZ0214-1]